MTPSSSRGIIVGHRDVIKCHVLAVVVPFDNNQLMGDAGV